MEYRKTMVIISSVHIMFASALSPKRWKVHATYCVKIEVTIQTMQRVLSPSNYIILAPTI